MQNICRFTNNMYYNTHYTIYIIPEYKSKKRAEESKI